jgi:tRNA(adenine34) deaminase
MSPKSGCAGSVINLLQMDAFNHQVIVEKAVLEKECSRMLSDFFKNMRKKNKTDATSEI